MDVEQARRLELLLEWHREEAATDQTFCAAHFESRPCCLDALTDDEAWRWVSESRDEARATYF